MKKIFSTLAVAGMLFVMAACSSSPVQKAADVYTKAAEQIAAEKDNTKALEIATQAIEEATKILAADTAYKWTKADSDAYNKANDAVAKALKDKGINLNK